MATLSKTHGSPNASPYAPPKTQVKRPKRMHDRSLTGEARVMAIGLWLRVLSALGVLGGLVLLAMGSWIAAPILIPQIAIAGFGVLVGSHLFDLRPWARWGFLTLTVLQALSLGAALLLTTLGSARLALALFGAGWSAAQLWALFGERGSRVFAEGYRERRDDRVVTYWKSVFFVVPAIGLGLILVSKVLVAVAALL